MKFAAYWQKLLDSHVISTFNDAGTLVNTNMGKGIIAAALYSAWAPSYFAPSAKKTMGHWRAASLPQGSAGAQVGADWGGSTYPVFSQSQHPSQAAAFGLMLPSIIVIVIWERTGYNMVFLYTALRRCPATSSRPPSWTTRRCGRSSCG
jgi:ABC-type sugar transport system permease subunit